MKFCRTPTLLSHASRILFSFTAAVVVVVVSSLLRFATTTTNLQFNKGKGGRRVKSGARSKGKSKKKHVMEIKLVWVCGCHTRFLQI